MVDLGKDTMNYIDNIVIKNRVSAGGRLKRFFVEVLDVEQNVVFSDYRANSVGNGVVLTFTVNDGTAGRYVRLRFEDSYKECLHVGEVEVWGYPIELPAGLPDIVEMAQGKPATASTVLGNNPAWKSNDGNTGTFHHSACGDAGGPWWMVDLAVESFVQDVIITNRVDCCGGRLKHATVEILDSDQNVVESRYIEGSVGNGKVVQKVFNENTSFGRFVKVSMRPGSCMHMAEVAVNGFHTMAPPTGSPTGTLSNVAVGKPTSHASTYQNNEVKFGAANAADGERLTYTHTKCGNRDWWQIDLEQEYSIEKLVLGNRLNCCGGRLRQFYIYFYDSEEVEIEQDRIYYGGTVGAEGTFHVSVAAQYVKIQLDRKDCLQLGEVEVWAY